MRSGVRQAMRRSAAAFLLAAAAPAWSQAPAQGDFWGAIDLGYGRLRLDDGGARTDLDKPYLGIAGGIALSPDFLIGLELSGWSIESSNLWDPSKGEGVSRFFLTSRYYPSSYGNTFFKLGGGYVSHWKNRPGGEERKTGWGATVGAGYDFALGRITLTPFADFGWASTEGERDRALTLGLGIGFGLQ
jgi:hypothetical protein